MTKNSFILDENYPRLKKKNHMNMLTRTLIIVKKISDDIYLPKMIRRASYIFFYR